jgi:type I restriction enzyme S subunit
MREHALPDDWRVTTIGEVAAHVPNAIVDGPFGSNLKLSDYVEEGVPVLQGKNITNDTFQWFDVRYISDRKAKELKRSSVRVGDILLVKIGSIGYSAVIRDLQGFDFAIIPANLAKITPNPEAVDTEYLHKWLTSPAAKRYLESVASKTAQPALSLGKIKSLPLSLPPLAEQRRIAEVLDRVEALRAKRRAALAQLDVFTQSIFLDLFGDPSTNRKGWPLIPIGEIGAVITGNTPSRAHPEYFGTAIEWIKSDNINTPHYYLTSASEGLSETGKAMSRTAPSHSILVTCIAGSSDCIGNAAMTDREVAFNQQINALVPHQGDPHFLYAQIRAGKRLIREASTDGMKGMVSKSRFEKILLPFPPIALQRDFAQRVVAIEKLKATHLTSLAELDALFAVLQHRAFRGEL